MSAYWTQIERDDLSFFKWVFLHIANVFLVVIVWVTTQSHPAAFKAFFLLLLVIYASVGIRRREARRIDDALRKWNRYKTGRMIECAKAGRMSDYYTTYGWEFRR